MVYFYIELINKETAVLTGDEARHCVDVLRNRIGDKVLGIDGQGNYIEGRVQRIEKTTVHIQVELVIENYNEPACTTGLIFSPLRQKDRTEYLIEKAVELGVTHLYPALCARTEKLGLNVERLHKIVLAALKQSQRSRMPQLAPLNPLNQVLNQIHQENIFNIKLFAHCDANQYLHSYANLVAVNNLVFAIGPVGDFTQEEIDYAETLGFAPVSFGSIRLRSETAVALALSYNKVLKGF